MALRCSLDIHLGRVSAIRATRGIVLLYLALLHNYDVVLWMFLWMHRKRPGVVLLARLRLPL